MGFTLDENDTPVIRNVSFYKNGISRFSYPDRRHRDNSAIFTLFALLLFSHGSK